MGRTWVDELGDELARVYDAARARVLFKRYRDAFSEGYQENYSPVTAVGDIRIIEGLSPSRPLGVDFYRRAADPGHCVGLKVWSHNRPIPLSERVPVLENMGFKVVDERTYRIARHAEDDAQGSADVWFHDMVLERADGRAAALEVNKRALETAFVMVMRGGAENDGYNALVLAASLAWRDVALIRAISRFLRQIHVPYSQGYMWATLFKHASIAADLVRLFNARFDPRLDISAAARKAREAEIAGAIEAALRGVQSLDEDRILRRFVNAIQGAIRTNFYQIDASGHPKQLIAIKFASRRLDAVPLPRPLYEIFVYSPRVEGVHLRFGKVARGGIRWSDRPQDFRTEILGLGKAQQVKNAVIVPVGAKGGFVPKRLTKAGPKLDRDAVQAEGAASYKILIDTLLDLTDNIGPDGVIPPPDVVRYDGDDPYLVVAADKGTATFSDIANAISADYGFWLGDAFASGGSAGYDHKKMGITARGAWECVKRHFREMDIDTQKTDFTVVGIGDMSGDVFGNGMLLSRHIRLQAAFDHRHIFLDPDPDPAVSFAERARLFDLPRSSWDDYDRKALSRGGGVFARSAKSIALSAEARTLLGLESASAAPNEVIRAILTLPVDLLWNGGIGTYVKASDERNAEVGDRANDALRINGQQLLAKVVGEGGNLGLTQRGRIEYALARGRLNTDFIDNSAGVNTSDVEVNIKIVLNPLVAEGKLSRGDRNRLLARQTSEVAALVLRNNYLQSQALSTLELQGAARLMEYQHLIRSLEREGVLNRALEFLPSDDELSDRRKNGVGLTRPELAILLAYSKIWLSNHLLASDVPEDPYLSAELERYFPAPMQERFRRAIAHHRLRREIIATSTTNSLINRMGPTFVPRVQGDTGAEPARIARAYTAAREIFAMRAVWEQIEALDNKVPAKLQYEAAFQTSRLLRHATYWLLTVRGGALQVDGAVRTFREGVRQLEAETPGVLTGTELVRFEEARKHYTEAGLPPLLATRIAALEPLNAALDIVEVAASHHVSVAETARVYFEVGTRIGCDWLQARIESLAVEGPW